MQNFVRGRGSYAPFLPGGLDPAVAVNRDENEQNGEDEEEEEETGWKTRAPGLRRGMKLEGGELCLEMQSGTILMPSESRRLLSGDVGLAIDSTESQAQKTRWRYFAFSRSGSPGR